MTITDIEKREGKKMLIRLIIFVVLVLSAVFIASSGQAAVPYILSFIAAASVIN